MEFPRHCHKPDGKFVEVTMQSEYDAVKANGWTDLPEGYVETPVKVNLADAINNVVIDFDEATEIEPKKRGRKSKG